MARKQKAAQRPSKSNVPPSSAVSSGESSSTFPPHVVAAISPRKYHPPPPEVTALHPGSVYVSRNFLAKSECDAWIQHAESSIGFEAVSHPATRFIAHRECGRIQRNDWTVAENLYLRMVPIINKVAKQIAVTHSDPTYGPKGCNGNIRLYKYEKGMSFGRHFDGSDQISRYPNGHTEITVLVYLSSCVGGATRFYSPHSTGPKKRKERPSKGGDARDEARDGIAFVPEVGSILLHVHGDRCLEHEADPVLQGVKYVLRTDVVYGTSGSGAQR